jgi:hypothetical protein
VTELAGDVFQRVAASLGTAVLAVVLQQRIEDRLPALYGPSLW